jgi:superfamily II DNA or RNA helicase
MNINRRKIIQSKLSSKNKSPKNVKNIVTELTPEYKINICSQSYIGKKGYTIPKSALTSEEIEFLKKDLFLKPIIMGAQFGAPATDDAFPVYRENDKKMYLPRFYGIERYGVPQTSELDLGENIDVEFPKQLRDYQDNIIDIYMKYVLDEKHETFGSGGILEVPCGRGKTVMALKIISLLKKKTLILVHKEFLMNQWIERIEEFLPNARVGKIQANVCDCENKDIVIGMIQTMYNKVFPQEIYSQFGLTIIDEVHRIGSEEFSKTLLKTITPYMLGISATVERKDKLSKLLYMFIGNKIYSEERKSEDPVCVRGIEYICNDNEFNEVELDYRGNPKFSTMISKISDYGPRSDFIVKVIGDLFVENHDAQIMVLAHNRSLLTYLYEAIEHRKIATVGYYVGGMKQKNLQETETRQIVLATYAMAAEALDIKSLSILIMASPKTDIIQSVGRILRVKHDNPIVVDIVDSHQLFQNQWKQRKRYYKKCNYRIRYIESRKYCGMNFDWNTDKTWLPVFEPKIEIENGEKVKKNNCKISCVGSDESSGSEDDTNNLTAFGGKCCIQLDEF